MPFTLSTPNIWPQNRGFQAVFHQKSWFFDLVDECFLVKKDLSSEMILARSSRFTLQGRIITFGFSCWADSRSFFPDSIYFVWYDSAKYIICFLYFNIHFWHFLWAEVLSSDFISRWIKTFSIHQRQRYFLLFMQVPQQVDITEGYQNAKKEWSPTSSKNIGIVSGKSVHLLGCRKRKETASKTWLLLNKIIWYWH